MTDLKCTKSGVSDGCFERFIDRRLYTGTQADYKGDKVELTAHGQGEYTRKLYPTNAVAKMGCALLGFKGKLVVVDQLKLGPNRLISKMATPPGLEKHVTISDSLVCTNVNGKIHWTLTVTCSCKISKLVAESIFDQYIEERMKTLSADLKAAAVAPAAGAAAAAANTSTVVAPQ